MIPSGPGRGKAVSDRQDGGAPPARRMWWIPAIRGALAVASVLEEHLGKSRYRQHGERVVQGQRMMQAASDIYLCWTKGWTCAGTSTGASFAT
jgi:hypothetical protein